MSAAEPATPDACLVRGALSGDKDQLGVLLQRHWETAVRLCSRVLGSAELARDAVQEAAIAAMTDLERLRSPERFGAWFCGIALNVARRWLRQLRHEVPGSAPDGPTDRPGPAEAAEAADLAHRVRAAIAVLPDGQRKAVLLFYLQGLSHREVAQELGITAGAVKARLHQARSSLAPRLARETEILEAKVMAEPRAAKATEWVAAHISEILRGGEGDAVRHIMIVAERDGARRLPIWIGPAEAIALAMALESAEFPRPYTYKLAASLVTASGGEITEVRITRLEPPMFYALVVVRSADGVREVDARPSDAVNLALATGAPILVDSALLDQVPPGGFTGELGSYPVATASIVEEARRRMAEAMQMP